MSTKSKRMERGRRIIGFALVTLVPFVDGAVNTPFLQVQGRHTRDISRLIHKRQTLSSSFVLQTIRGGGPFNNKNSGMETKDEDALVGDDPTPLAEVEFEEDMVVVSFQKTGETSQTPEAEGTSNEINVEEHGGNHALNNDQDLEEGRPSQSASTSITPSAGSVFSSPKWQNFQQRTIPAILLLAAVGAWSYFLKEDGMILLVLFAQVGMYKEATSVLGVGGGGSSNSPANVWNKWWWFMTFSIAVNGPRVFSWATTTLSSIASAMAVVGVIGNVLGFNGSKSSGEESSAVDNFQKYLQEAAISHLALVGAITRWFGLCATLRTLMLILPLVRRVLSTP
jgi:hypothetical protein